MKFAGIPIGDKAPVIIMGVLNIAPETFYKKSAIETHQEAADRAEKMIEDGADIIDLGAMSTAPGVKPISLEEEKKRLLPTLEMARKKIDAPISIDTQRASVAKAALDSGAQIINDVSGFKADGKMPQVAVDYDCYAVLVANRIRGRIRTAEKEKKDIDNISKIKEGLSESLQICKEHNINLDKVTVDPGIGFGKGAEDDLRVLANLGSLKDLNQPICVGVSRKSFIGGILNLEDPADRLWGSLGATVIAVMNGANMIRTHDPKETQQVIRVVEAIQEKM